jgi:predicted nucleotidyltransferase
MDKKEKISDLFFNYPMKEFHVRQISRDLKLNTKTVMKYLKILQKEGIINKIKKKHEHTHYEANKLSRIYKYEKSSSEIKKILRSGLIEFLEKQTKTIILFGSIWKGTHTKDSDIDIFIQDTQKKLNLNEFERKLNRKISILSEKSLEKLSKGLLNNIQQGYLLSGKLENDLQKMQRTRNVDKHRR